VSSAGWLGFTLAELGEFELAQSYAAMAQRAAEQSRHAYSQAIAWSLGGLVALARGHLDRAREQLGRSLDLCRQKDLTVWRPIPSSLLGLALVHLGRSEEGLPLLEDGVRLTEEMGVKAYLALWTLQWAEGLRAAGRFGHARDLAQRGLDLAVAHKERGHQARALRLVGDVALAQGDAGRAERSLSQALALTEELGMGPLGARCRLDLGRVHREAGRRQKAEDQLFEALGLFRQMDMRYWVDQAMTELKALGHLFVVAHYNLGLYEFLKDRLAGDPGATVVLDRRAGERRSRSRGATPSERRQSDRRDDRRTRDAALKSRGVIVVPGPGAGRHAPPPQPPAAG
jgi:tetratricopeptide (TPR) repeat protein